MNIVIDRGNSGNKIALFEKNTLVKSFQLTVLTKAVLLPIIEEFHPQASILCTVTKKDSILNAFLANTVPVFYEMNTQLSLPLTIDYKTPKTLGMDRIAAAVGALKQKPDTNLLIIDIGTAITVDFITDKGVYKGGNISPGPILRFRALHRFTNKLPLINENGDIPDLGYDTETAIRSGVIEGIVRELDSYITEYKKKQPVFAFLTGGYAFYFERRLKNAIFADGNLVLNGLNEILNDQLVI
ncbi:MAG: type III pantothenate kinase [Dysgonamonadaceae bacterium]|jgi:type III pantothenate kinase|nr:type III pantothenate kinase [Dysgonamonadaceae bacterium]